MVLEQQSSTENELGLFFSLQTQFALSSSSSSLFCHSQKSSVSAQNLRHENRHLRVCLHSFIHNWKGGSDMETTRRFTHLAPGGFYNCQCSDDPESLNSHGSRAVVKLAWRWISGSLIAKVVNVEREQFCDCTAVNGLAAQAKGKDLMVLVTNETTRQV